MPTGYASQVPDTPKATKRTVTPTRCSALVGEGGGTVLAEAAFAQGGLAGASFSEQIIAPQNGTAPSVRVKQIEALLQQCTAYSVKDSSGTGSVTVAALSFPEVGDYTLAVRATVEQGGLTAQGDFVYVAVGRSLLKVSTAGIAATLTGAELEGVVRTAVKKIRSVD